MLRKLERTAQNPPALSGPVRSAATLSKYGSPWVCPAWAWDQQVHLARPAVHEQLNYGGCLWYKVGRAGLQIVAWPCAFNIAPYKSLLSSVANVSHINRRTRDRKMCAV